MTNIQLLNNRSIQLVDERQWCRYVLTNDDSGANDCPELRNEPNCQPWCALNGKERRSPCAFDEPLRAKVWRRVNEYLAEGREKGWWK
jgi:hypothetical protein